MAKKKGFKHLGNFLGDHKQTANQVHLGVLLCAFVSTARGLTNMFTVPLVEWTTPTFRLFYFSHRF